MAEVGNWIGETTATVGAGDITLAGAIAGYTAFQSYGDGTFWYAIIDGDNREAGTCVVTYPNLVRSPMTTIVAGLFDGTTPPPISLSGNAQVFCTFNEEAYDDLVLSISLKEDDLGVPVADGYLLSSTTGGVRSWVAPPAGDITITAYSINSYLTELIEKVTLGTKGGVWIFDEATSGVDASNEVFGGVPVLNPVAPGVGQVPLIDDGRNSTTFSPSNGYRNLNAGAAIGLAGSFGFLLTNFVAAGTQTLAQINFIAASDAIRIANTNTTTMTIGINAGGAETLLTYTADFTGTKAIYIVYNLPTGTSNYTVSLYCDFILIETKTGTVAGTWGVGTGEIRFGVVNGSGAVRMEYGFLTDVQLTQYQISELGSAYYQNKLSTTFAPVNDDILVYSSPDGTWSAQQRIFAGNGNPGFVPNPGPLAVNPATDYLAADGTWRTPPAGGAAITVQDEGTPLTTAVTLFNFVGAGVTVTEPVADQVTVTIPGGAGGGDVTGPASSTDNAIARFDLATGKVIQNSGITIADGATGTLAGTNSGDNSPNSSSATAAQGVKADTALQTAANQGAGSPIVGTKTGTAQGFKTLVAGSNVVLTDATDTVTIASTSGTVSASKYTFRNNNSTTPISGDMTLSNNTLSTASNIVYMNVTNQNNVDITVILNTFAIGDSLYIQEANDSAINVLYTITSKSVGVSVATFGVSRVNSAGTVFSNNQTVEFVHQGSGAGASSLTVQDEGVSLTTAATLLNFTGGGATATAPVANQIKIDVPLTSGNGTWTWLTPGAANPAAGQMITSSATVTANQTLKVSTTSGGQLIPVSSPLSQHRSGGTLYIQSRNDATKVVLYQIVTVDLTGGFYTYVLNYLGNGSGGFPATNDLTNMGYIAPDVSLGQDKTLLVTDVASLQAAFVYVNSKPLGTTSQTATASDVSPPTYTISIAAGAYVTSVALYNVTAPVTITCTTPNGTISGVINWQISGCVDILFRSCAISSGVMSIVNSGVELGVANDVDSVNLIGVAVTLNQGSNLIWRHASTQALSRVTSITCRESSNVRIIQAQAGSAGVNVANQLVCSDSSSITCLSLANFTGSVGTSRISAGTGANINMNLGVTLTATSNTAALPFFAGDGGRVSIQGVVTNTAGYLALSNPAPGILTQSGSGVFIEGTNTKVLQSQLSTDPAPTLTAALNGFGGGQNWGLNNIGPIDIDYGVGVLSSPGAAPAAAFVRAFPNHSWSGAFTQIPPMIQFTGTQTLTETTSATLGYLFQHNATYTNTPGVPITMGTFYTLDDASTYVADGAVVGWGTVGPITMRAGPIFSAINSAALTIGATGNAYISQVTFSAQAGSTLSASRYNHFNIRNATLTGAGASLTNQVGLQVNDLTSGANNTQLLIGGVGATALPAGKWALWQHPTSVGPPGYWNLEAPVIASYRNSAVSITGLRTDATVIMTGASTVYTLPTLAVLIAAAGAGQDAYTAASLNGLTITVHVSQATTTVAAGAGITFATGTTGTFTAGQKKSYVFDGVNLWY